MMYELYQRRKFSTDLQNKRTRIRLLATFLTVLFFGLVGSILFVGFLFAWNAKDLPRPDKVSRAEGLSTIIYDRGGEKLYDIFQDANRIPISISDIPLTIKQATIAIEDKNFYKHQGVSEAGIIRAAINIFIFHNFQGGSTLTQQLVKNVLLTNEQKLSRKIKEAMLAIQIERKYSKDQILQMYLNEAPYGGTAVGVESASQYYFGKSAKDLDLLQSAILAGLPQAPSVYSPLVGSDPKAYIWRTTQVLRRMREDGYITPNQEQDAVGKLGSVKFTGGSTTYRAPHFVEFVKKQLIKMFGQKAIDTGGLKVTTTLDWNLQDKAQSIVKEEVDKAKYLKVSNGAAVVINPTNGEILAMIGSKDYFSTDSGGMKFNVVTQGLRQPGSTMKPITYATAFEKGYTASTVLTDVDTKYPSGDPTKPEYNPKNYDGKFRGPMQLRYALGNSINTIAVKVSALAGISDILHTAYDMGLSTLEPTSDNLKRFGLSLTLGGGEVTLLDLTNAYGVFATGGLYETPTSILKVTDSNGKVLYEYKPPEQRRVIQENIAYIVTHILSDNDARKEEFGPRSYLFMPGYTVAAKTGTTDDKRDNWTVGYTPHVVVGTWVGNNDNSQMNPALASGITGAAPIWNRIMKECLKGKKDESFNRPTDIIEMDIDGFGGGLPKDGYPTRKEVFIKGTEPTSQSQIYKSFKVSKKDANKLASDLSIAKGEYDTRDFIVISENDPVSTDGKNRWQEAIDAWVATQSDAKYHPPKDKESTNEQIVVSLKEPSDKAQINSNNVSVRVEAASVNDVTKIEIYLDGTLVKDTSGKSYHDSINIPNGQHTVRAKAYDSKGNSAEAQAQVGINEPYASPTPTPSQTPTPTP